MPPPARLRCIVRCPRRADRSRPGDPRPGGAVLDQPRLRRARRRTTPGSSGYGRAYRRLLDGAWGVADVEDCVAAAPHAVAQGWARPRSPGRARARAPAGSPSSARSPSTTSSRPAPATTASATWKPSAATPTSSSRTTTSALIGPYPERRDLYVARSPLHAADRIRRPVLSSSRGSTTGSCRRARPRPWRRRCGRAACGLDLVLFPGEGHGFRRAETHRPGPRAARSPSTATSWAWVSKFLETRRLLWCNPASPRGGTSHAQPVPDGS